MEGLPEKKSQPDIENKKNEVSRRDFLKNLGIAVSVTALGISQMEDRSTFRTLEKWEIEQSEKNWEVYEREILKELQKALEYLNSMDVRETATVKAKKQQYLFNGLQKEIDSWSFIIKDSIKDSNAQHDRFPGLFSQVRNSQMYRRYLKAFNDWLKMDEDKEMDLDEKYTRFRSNIDNVEQFLNNIIYSQKMKEEYHITVTGENTKFFLADIESFYKALGALPPFAIKKSGFKILSLRELNPGAGATMGGMEMAGQFRKWDPNAFYVYHELAHAFDEHIEKGTDKFGWANINRGAKPYAFSSGPEAIEAVNKNPSIYSHINEVDGYAKVYGWQGGVFEDKATISEALFNQYSLKELVNRSMNDPILRRKVEFMTGHKLDNPYIPPDQKGVTHKEQIERRKRQIENTKKWAKVHIKDIEMQRRHVDFIERASANLYNFGTPLTEKDYQDAGFNGFCYWPIWSRDEMGKIWMDAKYFNAILEGKKVEFKEEKGQTIREITKK